MADRKTISLKELRWFSFTSDMDSRNQLTIWQSVFYILEIAKAAGDDLFESMEKFEKLEIQSAEDAIEDIAETQESPKVLDDIDNDTYLNESKLPETIISQELTLLDSNRSTLVEYLGMPYTLIYGLLQTQVDKFVSGNRADLKISGFDICGYPMYLFSKGDLKKWKAVSDLKALGLIDIDNVSNRRQRSDNADNQKLTTGMLIHLLAKELPGKYKQGKDRKNVNFSNIYQEFEKACLDNEDDSFPKERTVTDNLKASYRLFREEVNLKEK
jgi:hypothetical protein